MQLRHLKGLKLVQKLNNFKNIFARRQPNGKLAEDELFIKFASSWTRVELLALSAETITAWILLVLKVKPLQLDELQWQWKENLPSLQWGGDSRLLRRCQRQLTSSKSPTGIAGGQTIFLW
jgi:hypothetical protein